MRTTLLPGLLRTLARNLGRGFTDVSLYEFGLVFRPRPEAPPVAPILRVDQAPTAQEIAQLEAALPDQPLHAGAVLTGNIEPAGLLGSGRPGRLAGRDRGGEGDPAGQQAVVRDPR